MNNGLTVGQYLVEQLANWGVKHIYGVPGDTFFPLLDALAKSDKVRFISTKHEAAAAFMASAEAKLTGRLAVCVGTSGPGLVNMLNGLADAHIDRAPVLAITGQVPSDKIGTGYKQYLDQQLMIQPLACYSSLLVQAATLPEVLGRAVSMAQNNGKVAHISIPKDLFAQLVPSPVDPHRPFWGVLPEPGPDQIKAAQDMLSQSKQPALLVGLGGRDAREEILQFAEALQAPIIQTLPAKGIVPGAHPLAIGGLGAGGSEVSTQVLQEADLIVMLGATWWPDKYTPKRANIMQLDAEAQNIGQGHPVDFGLIGPLARVLPRLCAQLHTNTCQQWVASVQERRSDWLQRIGNEARVGGRPVHPAALVNRLEKAIDKDAVICVDVGDHTVWLNRILQGDAHQVIISGSWRSIGFGLPAAIGCKLAAPERQVVLLTGDGGLCSVIGELLTVSTYSIPITVVVANNGSLAMEKNRMLMAGMNPESSELNNPDFAKLAELCGWGGVRITDASELEQALRDALEANRQGSPVLVDVITADTVFPQTDPYE